MNILLVNTLFEPYKVGGAEVSVRNLAENLSEKGQTVGIITIGERKEAYDFNGILVWRLKHKSNYWAFDEQKKGFPSRIKWHLRDISNKGYDREIEEVFAVFKPDVIHTNNLSGISVRVWGLAKKHRIKIIHTLRDYYLLCPRATRYRNSKTCESQCLDCKMMSYPKIKPSHHVDHVVGISKHILKVHCAAGYFKQSKQSVIYNGFHIDHSPGKKRNFKSTDFLRIGFIGQVTPAKGIYMLLRSLKALSDHPNWKLYIAGRVSEQFKLDIKALLPQSRYELLGFIPKEQFYEQVNILVVPSLWEEPFGRIILEGATFNLPMLATKVGGIQEILESNPTFMFEPNEESLTAILRRIMIQPEFLNEFRFPPAALKKFDIDEVSARYIEIYEKLCYEN